MKITIIGTGNVATQLGSVLKARGNKIVQVYGRNKSAAKLLSNKFSCPYTTSLNRLLKQTDFLLVAVKDDAIKEVANKISFTNKIIVHTSGSVSIDVFKKRYKNYGVLYPVVSFSEVAHADIDHAPICIEANNESTEQKIISVAKSFSKKVFRLDSSKRRTVHIAAIFANNFVNHLYSISERMLTEEKIPFDILYRIICQTALNSVGKLPSELQTGPAKRGDKKVIAEHLKLLSSKKDLQKIYKLLTESIQRNS